MNALQTLLAGIVDYAGLFPPAGLDMRTAVANFARYRSSETSWMLGRIVVPVSRIEEFRSEAGRWLPRAEREEPWRISALVGEDIDSDIDRIFEFNRVHAHDPDAGLAVIDTIEARASSPAAIDAAMKIVPEQVQPFFELPSSGDTRAFMTAIAGTGAMAKIRTGGVRPELIPPIEDVASFIGNCASAGIGFKATAGLHHPVRAERALTYEDDAPRAEMHGFLNVFLGAALVKFCQADVDALSGILADKDPGAFQASDDAVAWRGTRIEEEQILRLRSNFAISFGSCSFEEPVDDLRTLEMI